MIKKIFIVGAGTMGNGIAQTAAVSGFDVVMMDVDASQIVKAQAVIAKSVEKLFQKERISEEAKEKALGIETTLIYIQEGELLLAGAVRVKRCHSERIIPLRNRPEIPCQWRRIARISVPVCPVTCRW